MWTLVLSDTQAEFLRVLIGMALQDGEWIQADIPELSDDPDEHLETELANEILAMLEPGGV